ncbi:MAG: peptide chain release factor N(5)-glutamine methyltransferase, partial [Oscillospiraceae bacterium]|nr:peptide chain release factor N(5)-glutamine methyltransferase [Oscillospiraceae bacterium]
MKTYSDIYLAAGKRLREAGIEASNLEARLLAASASGKTVADFLRDARLYVADNTFEQKLEALVDRRLAGEPVAYITRQWEFHGLPLLITEDVLIPRDDTEVLVEQAIELVRAKGPDTRVLDLCCGSGCIGLSIAGAMRGAKIVMADISDRALAVARQNALRNNLTKNVTCLTADALQQPPMLFGWFDLIVCNPPYIPSAELNTLDISVKDYEPHGALDGGEDGLDFYRQVTDKWRAVLKTGGTLLYECG